MLAFFNIIIDIKLVVYCIYKLTRVLEDHNAVM